MLPHRKSLLLLCKYILVYDNEVFAYLYLEVLCQKLKIEQYFFPIIIEEKESSIENRCA